MGKLLLIVALAGFLVERVRRLTERETTSRMMLLAVIPAMLVIAQPDLGSGLVYIAIVTSVLFVAGHQVDALRRARRARRRPPWCSCSSPRRRSASRCSSPTRSTA